MHLLGILKVKALEDFVLDTLQKNGVDVEAEIERLGAMRDSEGNAYYSSREVCIEEIVADSMFEVFTNEKFTQEMLDENPSVFRKIAKKVKQILADIKAAVSMLGNSDAAIRALKDDTEALEKINAMFDSLLEKAGEKYKAESEIGQKNNADQMAARFSANKSGSNVKDEATKYSKCNTNLEIIEMIKNVESKKFKPNDKVYFENISDDIAEIINNILGINVKGFKVAVEARQIYHILKDHGKEGKADKSLSNDDDIAKMDYVIKHADDIRYAGKTEAYSYMRDGRNRTADTVMYEKHISDKSYYVIQAVPDAKAKTLYIVSAFIGKPGIKKEAPQLINAESPDATPANGSVVTFNNIISEDSNIVKENSVKRTSDVSDDKLSELKEKREGIVKEYRELKAQIEEIKSSAEYVAFDNEARNHRKGGSRFGGIEAIIEIRSRQKQWADESGLSEIEERYSDVSEKLHDYDLLIYMLDKELKEKATVKLAKKVKGFSTDEVSEYTTRAAKKFGVTKKFDNAGYMLPDGTLLDFSDGQGYRVLDHREIREVLDFLPDNGNRSDGLIQFMNMGNIRMQIGGIDISRAPSKAQTSRLKQFFDYNNGEITVDFSKENGDNAGSVEYPAGTSSFKILNDIKTYFETGILPQISTTAAFHNMFSAKQTSPIQAHYAEVIRENRNFRQILSLLDEMQYSSKSGNIHLSSKDIDRIARDFIKANSSKYDGKKLSDELTVIYDYLANSGQNADTEEIYQGVLNIASEIFETRQGVAIEHLTA